MSVDDDAKAELQARYLQAKWWCVCVFLVAVLLDFFGVGVSWHWVPWVPWVQRSGAVMVIVGTLLGFKAADKVIARIKPPEAPKVQKDVMIPTKTAPTLYGGLAFRMIGVGTLVWGFGDIAEGLVKCVFHRL